VIELRELTKTYTIDSQTLRAVDHVSLLVNKGDMVSIIGHSGSGKTTLLSLIGGLTRPDSGQVLIDGADIWSMDDDRLSEFRNKKINFIYQFSSLIPTLTSLENVMLPTAFGDYTEDVEAYSRELLKIVGLEEKVNSYPAHLSGGQQRRVAIARAFVNRPEIILADEPTGDLDEETEKEVIQLFKKMNAEKEITFIIVTHNKEIAGQATKQYRMNNGVFSLI
jgi:putative ABC transport system ATP-binding protein/lipoprotein-releasing system ATP-binding protein